MNRCALLILTFLVAWLTFAALLIMALGAFAPIPLIWLIITFVVSVILFIVAWLFCP
jgi:hypothetical protein